MNRILIDLPEVIETPRLKLQMPKAGFGTKMHAAITDGYQDYVKWLNWDAEMPTEQQIEEECRETHGRIYLT